MNDHNKGSLTVNSEIKALQVHYPFRTKTSYSIIFFYKYENAVNTKQMSGEIGLETDLLQKK